VLLANKRITLCGRRGKLEAEYRLIKSTSKFGCMFRFEPDAGTLAPGDVQIIKVKTLHWLN